MSRTGNATLSLLVAAGLAACTTPAASAPATVASAPGSASASASAQSSEGGTAAMELTRGDVLPPGRYTRTGFSPTVTFELDGPWYAEQQYTGFFDVQQDVGSPDVIAVQFAKPSEVYGAEGASVHVETAAEAAAALRDHPGLVILGESGSTIDGLPGFVVEVEHAGETTSNAGIMLVPPGPLTIAPERRLWVAFTDTDDGLLAIMVGGSVARWDEALATAEPVLETVTIGD